jgi:hypothetical protein
LPLHNRLALVFGRFYLFSRRRHQLKETQREGEKKIFIWQSGGKRDFLLGFGGGGAAFSAD